MYDVDDENDDEAGAMAMTDVAITINDNAAPLVMAMMTGTPEAIAVMVTTTILLMTAMVVPRLYGGDCTMMMGQQSGWPATAERNRCATHPRQQPINGDSLGRRRGESGAIWGDGTTDEGQGGGNLVEILMLHEITSKPIFRSPQSIKGAGTYSACILGVRLRYPRHDQLVFRAQLEA
jgi:hypothetical protein